MRIHVRAVVLALSTMLLAVPAGGADGGMDAEGFITRWLVLAPLALDFEQSGAEGVGVEQIEGEARLRPERGDKVKFGANELFWKEYTAADYFIDFGEFVTGGVIEDCVAYAVAYVVADRDHPDVKMKVGSDDQCRAYLNGKEVHTQTDFRPLKRDSDAADVALYKGVNVLVFKVVNEKVDWQGCVRFVDANDKPVAGLKVQLTAK